MPDGLRPQVLQVPGGQHGPQTVRLYLGIPNTYCLRRNTL